jgi:nucleotide-binding universal stress UspA family protein
MNAMIVVGWSPDKYGEAAVRHGVEEARRRQAGIVVVNATRGDAYVDEGFAGRAEVSSLGAELGSEGIGFEIRQSMGDDVADQILEVADEVDAELVVVGVRRRSPVGKLIMGSVAQRVILGAGCPVLAVKP